MSITSNMLKQFKAVGKAFSTVWRWYIGQFKGRPWWRKLLAGIVSFFIFVALYVFCVIFNVLWLFGKSPSINDIINPKTAAASYIYSADGKELGKFFSENRSPVPYDSISPVFFQALVSTEDERFYSHHGIDYQGLVAAVKDAAQGHSRGASTISQQLVKNMFRIRTHYSTGLLGKIPGLSILIKKSKEMIIATELEMICSKEEILEMYANTVDFGSNAFGIKTAAKTYFNTTPQALKAEEAAVLVGLLKATSAYNPRINPDNSLRRRNVVLNNMFTHRAQMKALYGKAAVPDKIVLDSLTAMPLSLNFNVENAYDGKALYFRDAVREYIKENCPDVDVYSDGLKIYTTLDSRMQQYAEASVREQMMQVQKNFDRHWRGIGDPWRDEKGNVIPDFIEDLAKKTNAYKELRLRFPNEPDSIDHYLNEPHPVKLFDYNGPRTEIMSTLDSIRYMVKFMHTGFVAMEPQTGHVKAYVGDIDFKTWKYDKVQAMRQPGSTFKLFVYATAMKQGLTPADTRKDSYIRMEVYDAKKKETSIWQPHNSNGRFSNAYLPLRSAFAQSVNTIAVNLGQETGIENVVATAHDMGIKSSLDATPSLPLGSSDVNLFELVNAYGTVANGGVHVEPVLVTKILDSEGNIVYEAEKKENRALSETAAFYMQQLLKAGVTDGGGTSQTLAAARYLGRFGGKLDMGGKTGTSNNHSDAWFVGVTPSLVGGAWVGGEYRSIHFRTGRLGQGSRTALPIVADFMRRVMDDPAFAKYVCKYGEPPAEVEPSSYQRTYYRPEAETDSTETDSADAGVETPVDLMGIGEDGAASDASSEGTGDAPASPANHSATPASQSSANKKNGTSSSDNGETNLFE